MQRVLFTRVGWLSSTPPAFQNAVLARSVFANFAAGETLYKTGDPAGGIYGLLSGGLRVDFATGARPPFSAHLYVPGSWVGEAAAISGEPRLVDLVATRLTQTVYLSLPAVNEILREDPEAFRAFARLTQWHLSVAIVATGDLMFREPEKRLLAVLLRLSGCRSETPPELGIVDIDTSQDELASMANVGRTAASAFLRRLEAAGQIETGYRRLRVLAPDDLRALLAR